MYSVIAIGFIRVPSLILITNSRDPTFDAIDVAIWSCIEINLAIVCACTMTLKPLATRVGRQVLGTVWPGYNPNRSNEYISGRPPTVGTRRERNIVRSYELDEDEDDHELPKLASPSNPNFHDQKRPTSDTQPWMSGFGDFKLTTLPSPARV
jgi:hypothetical protein